MRNGSNLRYVHQDSLGSTSVVTNSSGSQLGYRRYYPYGSTRDYLDPLDTDKKFTGQRLDATGLYYYGARYYDPSIGRFISADPIVSSAPLPNGVRISALTVAYHIEEYSPYTLGYTPWRMDPQELNRYSYALNNPLKYTDPDGNQQANPFAQAAQALLQTGIPHLRYVAVGLLIAAAAYETYNTQQGTGSSLGSTVVDFVGDVADTFVSVTKTTVDLVGTAYDKLTGWMFSKKGGQGDKELRKGVEEKVDRIREHEDKIANNPNSPGRGDWEKDIDKAKNNIKRDLDRMGPAARQQTQDWLKEQGIDVSN